MAATDPGLSLELRSVKKRFLSKKPSLFSRSSTYINAVDDVTLSVPSGRTLGLVGESGSGKSTLARLILKLEDITSGDILFSGRSILNATGPELKRFRQQVQMVFQDPFGSLNPRMSVGELISEAWIVHPEKRPQDPDAKLAELMEQVGLRPEWRSRYPGQFSGGQRQRIGIARALAVGPKLLVCDEAVSALDVSVQAQILKLLKGIQRDTGITCIFISHDLSVVRYISDHVAVMYLGSVVESGPAQGVYDTPTHPYTQALLAAVPSFQDVKGPDRRPELQSEPPDPANPPSGCPFRTRCWRAQARCADERPPLVAHDGDRLVACHFPEPWRPAA